MKFSKNYNHQSGITLIELVLYIAISSIMLLALFYFYRSSLESSIKSLAVHRVQVGGAQSTMILEALFDDMSSITTPIEGSSGSTLVFTTNTTSTNPTRITIAANAIEVTEDADDTPRSYVITSNNVIASNFSVQNVSSGTTVSLQYSFTLESNAASNANKAYTYTNDFQGSATAR